MTRKSPAVRFAFSFWPGIGAAALLLGFSILVFAHILSLPQAKGSINLDSRVWSTLLFTLFQAGLSTLLSLVAGTAIAWSLLHQRRFFGRNILVALFSSALVLPTLVAVLGLVTVFGRNGWINGLAEALTGTSFGPFIYGLAGILIAHVYFNASFAVRGLLNRLESVPHERWKLARSLGFTAWQRFRFIEWPAMKSALPGIGITIFLLCFTSFAIVLVLGGSPRYNTLEVALYEAVKLDFDLAQAVGLALVQIVVCAGLVLVAASIRSSVTAAAKSSYQSAWPEPAAARWCQYAIIAFAGFGFIAPLTAVIYDGLQAEFSRLVTAPTFVRGFFTSLLIATASSLLTVMLALAIGMARRNFNVPGRFSPNFWTRMTDRALAFSGTLFLAVPSLVLGLGMFLIARQFAGPLVYWTVAAVLCANVLMALPFSLAILTPALEKSALRFDRLCFSLGITGIARWRYAEWPLLRGDLGYVVALAFCFSLGDLGVIALFGSQNFATLPWLLYQNMGSYRTHDAAGIALILLALIVAIFTIVPRIFSGKSHVEA
ncbi:MAG: thiamine/thiamine pyrophosphate ABC transporter permease ThiP [Hyphomicrobiales bacterium]